MPSVLDFARYKGELERQLLRRIGYTNGLHKIRRFARVVEYLYGAMPCSARLLAEIIMREENRSSLEDSERALSGAKYARGIVDVCSKLELIEGFGPKLSLSSHGYACHAINQQVHREQLLDAFLLSRVVSADGEYSLNILRLIAEGTTETDVVGRELFRRFLLVIEQKTRWAKTLDDRFTKDAITVALVEARGVLEKALQNENVGFFLKHTINPRLEWLNDLGCITSSPGQPSHLTQRGARLLEEVKAVGCWTDSHIFLPFDSSLADYLGLPNVIAGSKAVDFVWRWTAATFRDGENRTGWSVGPEAILDYIERIYPHVKLATFNEADLLSCYEVLASELACAGWLLPACDFESVVKGLIEKYPDRLFKLSKRRGLGMYIALKSKP
jgi:hypothetical protein